MRAHMSERIIWNADFCKVGVFLHFYMINRNLFGFPFFLKRGNYNAFLKKNLWYSIIIKLSEKIKLKMKYLKNFFKSSIFSESENLGFSYF